MFPLPLTDKLTNMLNAKYVRPTTFKPGNAEQFRRNAAAFLQSAKDAKQPPIVRYTLAYEAVHALAIGFLYLLRWRRLEGTVTACELSVRF